MKLFVLQLQLHYNYLGFFDIFQLRLDTTLNFLAENFAMNFCKTISDFVQRKEMSNKPFQLCRS